MPLLLCIGDLHFSSSNIEYTNQVYGQIESFLLDNKVDTIVLLGDILHNHETLHTIPFNKSLDFIAMLASYSMVYIIIGNHDYINDNQFLTTNHPFNMLKTHKNITIVDKVVRNGDFIFCPYVKNGRIIEALDTEPLWKTSKYVFSHIAVNGIKYGPVAVSDSVNWEKEYPILISGHIHDRQKFSENVIYVGSAYQITDGEPYNKRLLLLNTETNQQSTIDLFVQPRGILRIDLSTDEWKDEKKDIKDIENVSKIVVSGTIEEIRLFKETQFYKLIVKQGKIIQFDKQQKQTDQKNVECRTFMEILMDMLSEEEKHTLGTFL